MTRQLRWSIDDFAFGVSAIGAERHESLGSYVSPVRRDQPLERQQ